MIFKLDHFIDVECGKEFDKADEEEGCHAIVAGNWIN